MHLVSELPKEPWRRRLYLPNYAIGDAARYAQISARTVQAWHRATAAKTAPLSSKEKRAALSYLQLIELAMVAAFRREGITLQAIRNARDYLRKQLENEFPLAAHQFKTDGRHLIIDYAEIEGDRGRGKHLFADLRGQLAWDEIIAPRLKEFEYERQEQFVVRWHLAGPTSPIVIDPRLSFGAPTVNGTPTWAIAGRWNAGESNADIADDFGIEEAAVRRVLDFEGLSGKRSRAVH